MTALHELDKTGRFQAFWNAETAEADIHFEGARIISWNETPEIDDVYGLFAELMAGRKPATAEEMMAVMQWAMCADTWYEVCDYDLEKFGEVGVSF